jgi:hypothetical protein
VSGLTVHLLPTHVWQARDPRPLTTIVPSGTSSNAPPSDVSPARGMHTQACERGSVVCRHRADYSRTRGGEAVACQSLAWTHDIGAREHKFDRALVDLHPREQVGILVQQSQRWDDRPARKEAFVRPTRQADTTIRHNESTTLETPVGTRHT